VEHVCQIRFVEVGLLEHLLDAGLVLGSSHAGGSGALAETPVSFHLRKRWGSADATSAPAKPR